MVLEMRFLHGLLKRRKEISFLKPTPLAPQKKEQLSGRWFFWRKKKTRIIQSEASGVTKGVNRFQHRMRHFGIGVTLLSYFLPANYQGWLLVVEDLEHKGKFEEFSWALRVGTGDPAATALIYGLLRTAGSLLAHYLQRLARFNSPPQITMVPNFQKASLDTFFHCIFRIKLGHIIIAAIWARFRYRFLKGGASQ